MRVFFLDSLFGPFEICSTLYGIALQGITPEPQPIEPHKQLPPFTIIHSNKSTPSAEVRQATQLGKQDPQAGRQATHSGTATALVVWRTYMKSKLLICCKCTGGLTSAHVCSLVGCSVSGKAKGLKLLDTLDFPVGFLFSSGPTILSPTLPFRLPEVLPIFSSRFLYLVEPLSELLC